MDFSFPDLINNHIYSIRIFFENGKPPYVFKLESGNLPPGLILESDGFVVGKTNKPGDYSFSISIKDSQSNITQKQFSVKVFDVGISFGEQSVPFMLIRTFTPSTLAIPNQEVIVPILFSSETNYPINEFETSIIFDPNIFELNGVERGINLKNLPNTILDSAGKLTFKISPENTIYGPIGAPIEIALVKLKAKNNVPTPNVQSIKLDSFKVNNNGNSSNSTVPVPKIGISKNQLSIPLFNEDDWKKLTKEMEDELVKKQVPQPGPSSLWDYIKEGIAKGTEAGIKAGVGKLLDVEEERLDEYEIANMISDFDKKIALTEINYLRRYLDEFEIKSFDSMFEDLFGKELTPYPTPTQEKSTPDEDESSTGLSLGNPGLSTDNEKLEEDMNNGELDLKNPLKYVKKITFNLQYTWPKISEKLGQPDPSTNFKQKSDIDFTLERPYGFIEGPEPRLELKLRHDFSEIWSLGLDGSAGIDKDFDIDEDSFEGFLYGNFRF